MTSDPRSPYDRFLGVSDQDYIYLPGARWNALSGRLVQAMEAQNYAEAQVYALLMLVEKQPGEPVEIRWAGWEDFASALGTQIFQAISQLNR